LRKALVCAAAVALIAILLPATAARKPKPAKVLFLVGGGFHDYKSLPPILADKLNATGDFQVTITEDRNELTAPKINKYDVALFYTQGGEITPEQEKGLTDFVSKGKGWVGIHSASDSFTNSDAYWNMVGGRFSGHGGGDFHVKIVTQRLDVSRGLTGFDVNDDETYDHKFHKDAKIIAFARREPGGEPAAWIRFYEEGRVFYTGLGHGQPTWENPAFQKLMIRGMYWAAGRKTPCKEATGGTGCRAD